MFDNLNENHKIMIEGHDWSHSSHRVKNTGTLSRERILATAKNSSATELK
ncbi:MAG: hypothetical protein KAG97_00785 [Victivallales bacterium]|nr:hypothetical protein [Victivallales bacterium]